jgi:hypothetical protein
LDSHVASGEVWLVLPLKHSGGGYF